MAIHWNPKLPQLLDRLAELYISHGLDNEAMEVTQLRQHVEDVKRKMTEEIMDRLIQS